MKSSKLNESERRQRKAGLKVEEVPSAAGIKKVSESASKGGNTKSKGNTKANGRAAKQTVAVKRAEPVKQANSKKGGKADKAAEKALNKKKQKARKVLVSAVEDEVIDQSSKIAKTLVNGVVDGNIQTTDLVISMIEKKKDEDGSERHGGLTTADLLGSEDVWESETFEAMEDASEVGFGGREPEGSNIVR